MKGSIVQHPLLNQAKITLSGRIAFGCPGQTMSLEWLSLSRNCPGGGWGFNEQRKYSYTIIPREFPPECVLGGFQLSYSSLGSQKGNAPQFLGTWLYPLASQPLVQGACHGSQHWTNKDLSHPLCQRRVQGLSATTLTLQSRPPKDQPHEALSLFVQSLKKEPPPLPPGGRMGTGERRGWEGLLRPPLLILDPTVFLAKESVSQNCHLGTQFCEAQWFWWTSLREDSWGRETTACTPTCCHGDQKCSALDLRPLFSSVFFFFGSYLFNRLTNTNPGCG